MPFIEHSERSTATLDLDTLVSAFIRDAQPSVADERLTFNFSGMGLPTLPPECAFRYARAEVRLVKAVDGFTAKHTVKLALIPLPPFTVTVAV